MGGLNMVGGEILDRKLWDTRMNLNMEWIRSQVALYNGYKINFSSSTNNNNNDDDDDDDDDYNNDDNDVVEGVGDDDDGLNHNHFKEKAIKALVIFGHDDYKRKNSLFFDALSNNVQYLFVSIPTIYIHEANDHSELHSNALNTTNLWFLQVKGSVLPFMKVTVNPSLDEPFHFD